MKNNTNQLLSYLILVILFNPIYLFSQEQPDERRIKGSKEYYWDRPTIKTRLRHAWKLAML